VSSRHLDPLTCAIPYLSFFLTGIITTLLGPILPWLTARWSLADEEAGVFFTAQFAASLAAGFASSLVVSRLGEGKTISLGLACMALGATGVGVGPAGVALAGMATCGIGMGLTVPTTNILVARMFRSRAAGALSAVNLAWGAGAAAWPLAIAASRAPRTAVHVLGLALFLLAVLALFTSDSPAPSAQSSSEPRVPTTWWPWIFFSTFFFLYGGVEAAVGGWVTELARRLDPTMPAAVAAAGFWGGLTAGRGAVAVLVAEPEEATTALRGALVAPAAIGTLLAVDDARAVVAAAAVAGVGLAPLFPIIVAVLARGRISAAAGPLISLSGVGGAIIPWMVGVVSTRTGALQAGMAVPFVGCLVIGCLHGAFWWRRSRGEAL
jgi:fucose permease